MRTGSTETSSVLNDLAQALLEAGGHALPANVAHETRRCLLNVAGTSIGASRSAELDALVSVALGIGGSPVACVPGRPELLDPYWSACATGFAAHFDDFDDTHLETVIHPGAVTLAVLIASAATRQFSGAEALSAAALGIEAQLRVGMAVSPSHYDAGWHITGTCGVVGAAVTAGLVRHFDAHQLASAIALSMQMSVGQREGFGTPVKPFHAGKAATNGLIAAELVAHGASPDDPGVIARAWFGAMAEHVEERYLEPGAIGAEWLVLDNTYKPYPCGIVAHPAIEAAVELFSRIGGERTRAVESVRVRCNPLVVELMGRREAATGLEARFCAIHGVAVGLLTGRAGLAEFSDEMSVAPDVVALRARTELDPDDRCPRDAATVTVREPGGSEVVSTIEVAAGSSGRPLTDAQLEDKVRALIEPVLPGRSERIASVAWRLGDGADVGELIEAMEA